MKTVGFFTPILKTVRTSIPKTIPFSHTLLHDTEKTIPPKTVLRNFSQITAPEASHAFLTSTTKPLFPGTSIRNFSHTKASEISYKTPIEEIKITPLLPENPEHFEAFKKIITNEHIVFTSSWIDKWFGIKQLRQKCHNTELKLKMIDEGDDDISLPKEVVDSYKQGMSPTQITLNRFFAKPENQKKLMEIYLKMGHHAAETGLGYYKFEDKEGNLMGGGALAPLSDEKPVEKVDIALHILTPKQGSGTICLKKLLTKAFEEHEIKQVWGSSIINHPGTPTLCARHGMMIRNYEGMKYYFIDREMWEANKKKQSIMDDPESAANYYDPKKGTGR